MGFEIGDKVVFSKNPNSPRWIKSLRDKNIYSIILRKCPILPSCCIIVRLSNGREEHVFNRWIQKVNVKNEQLLFNFME